MADADLFLVLLDWLLFSSLFLLLMLSVLCLAESSSHKKLFYYLTRQLKTYYDFIMKLKRVLAATSGAILPLFAAAQAFAQEGSIQVCSTAGIGQVLCNYGTGEIGKLIGTLINAAFIFAALIALAYLIWGGIKWITSGGEKSGVEGARNHIIAAIIGLVVIFLSYFIINVILYIFTGQNVNSLVLPRLTGN